MKLIHCADVHLDSKMNANLPKEKARERKAEILATFRRMVEYAAQNEVDAILIAGDFFDTKTVSATTRNYVKDTILEHPQIRFYYLRGNHDEGYFLTEPEEKPDNLYLFGKEWTSYPLDAIGNVVLTGVELNSDNSKSVFHTLTLSMDKINIVMLHGQESEYHAKDKTEVVNIGALRNKGIDYLALGHVHAQSGDVLDKRGYYYYCGCLEGRGFDECGEHGFVLLNVNEEEKTITREFVNFAKRKLYTIEVDITGCTSTVEIEKRMREKQEELRYPSESLIKFELVGNLDVESEKETDFLAKEFEEDFYYVKVKDSSGYQVDYEAFEKDISLKGEFIRTVKARTDLSEEDKAQIIHYGLGALAGEEILRV